MSGGSLNYWNAREPIERLKKEVMFGKNRHSEEVIYSLRKTIRKLREAEVYSHRAEWFLSGDDSEKTFRTALEEDLAELDKEPPIPFVLPECEMCEYCSARRCEIAGDFDAGFSEYAKYKEDASDCNAFEPTEDAVWRVEHPGEEYDD